MDFLADMDTKYIKGIIGILLCFVIVYSSIKEYHTYQAVSASVMNEIPIYCVETNGEKEICLTFDAAWGDEDLDEILAILEAHNAKATFFVTGDWASRFPEAIQKINDAGHELGNHGANHKHMPTLSKEEMLAEIEECHRTVYAITGKDMTLFRAPYGDWSEEVVATAKEAGYYSINWDVDSLDWKDYGVESIIDKVCNHKDLSGGSIILLHNGSTYTKDALDTLLTNLEVQGYSFVTVSELIYKDNYTIDHAGKQISN